MAQHSGSASSDSSTALDLEANHIDKLMNGGQSGKASKKAKEGASGFNNSTQVEQDLRIDKAKADAKAAGGGPDKQEDGLNQDG
ncbi:hypothetical protein P7D22_21870 [Lichenihabitans sp. Uapishka_5]|uniref:hypothetical protein n=1 Tax=Lichenihabitans sp. Uapishka_5 TaxID=3037302 RepID=UPI0029E818F0|nr:hypothetical protein [Lichenihabitans sp. Uapishka_5]MDX7953815.1 hypothetical protein [Lichenihabitans sp. Uapishka_5]